MVRQEPSQADSTWEPFETRHQPWITRKGIRERVEGVDNIHGQIDKNKATKLVNSVRELTHSQSTVAILITYMNMPYIWCFDLTMKVLVDSRFESEMKAVLSFVPS